MFQIRFVIERIRIWIEIDLIPIRPNPYSLIPQLDCPYFSSEHDADVWREIIGSVRHLFTFSNYKAMFMVNQNGESATTEIFGEFSRNNFADFRKAELLQQFVWLVQYSAIPLSYNVCTKYGKIGRSETGYMYKYK